MTIPHNEKKKEVEIKNATIPVTTAEELLKLFKCMCEPYRRRNKLKFKSVILDPRHHRKD